MKKGKDIPFDGEGDYIDDFNSETKKKPKGKQQTKSRKKERSVKEEYTTYCFHIKPSTLTDLRRVVYSNKLKGKKYTQKEALEEAVGLLKKKHKTK